MDTSTAPNPILWNGVKGAASFVGPLASEIEAEELRTRSLSKYSVNPELTPAFRPGKVERLIFLDPLG
jgi:hypothetical protein